MGEPRKIPDPGDAELAKPENAIFKAAWDEFEAAKRTAIERCLGRLMQAFREPGSVVQFVEQPPFGVIKLPQDLIDAGISTQEQFRQHLIGLLVAAVDAAIEESLRGFLFANWRRFGPKEGGGPPLPRTPELGRRPKIPPELLPPKER